MLTGKLEIKFRWIQISLSGHIFSISYQSSHTMLWSVCLKVMKCFLTWAYVVWDFYRTCPTRIVIGMKPVSIASSARTPWWTNLLLRRKSTFFVLNVTQMNTPPSVVSAKRPSCQVRPCLLWRHKGAFVKYFLKSEEGSFARCFSNGQAEMCSAARRKHFSGRSVKLGWGELH